MARQYVAGLVLVALGAGGALAQESRVDLAPAMVVSESKAGGDAAGLVDEQRLIVGPPTGKPSSAWSINSVNNKSFPFSAYLDLGAEKCLSSLWLFDTHGSGDVAIATGRPDAWTNVATYGCGSYMQWASIPLDTRTRYVRLTRMTPGAQFTEIALYEYSPEAWSALQARKAAEARAAAEREAALKRAREEALKRPLVDLAPYGKLSLVEEIDCAGAPAAGGFAQYPDAVSRVESILDRPCRVLPPTPGEAAYFSYRIGKRKLLRAGGVYVVTVEYPEDAPRSMVVVTTGNETSRGFHTGAALGDGFHTKYVNSFPESLDVPLSGRWETWSLLVRLHDRYPEKGLVRGNGQRPLTPEDGFDVTIAQFSAENIPVSKGAAVSRIRLFEVIDPDTLAQPLRLPPADLPHRRLFWREEMADGLLGGKTNKKEERGLDNRLDWYRNKAELMRFLGMNTYAKDLLEFGACQHWDPTPYGGNDWVFFDGETKDLWAGIVGLMGEYGFDVLPYYEYSGSKGNKGIGHERRCKPLTRDDGYTHIKWIESANADVTDPATIEDFRKMLDLTVVRLKDKARFAGAWIRPRSQMPVSFGPGALGRFAADANGGKPVTRDAIKADKALYGRYLQWWEGKRRDFFVAMRDYLRANGVKDAFVLYTGCPGEPGVGFDDWEPRLVTDNPAAWTPIVAQDAHKPGNDRVWQVLTPRQVADQDLYLRGLLAPGLNWGDWEVHHAKPADDPQNYRDVDGVLFSHAFNRLYTVLSPKTFDAYRAPAGLALVRHYSLNENMMFDKKDQTVLGYFVADVERAGPYCMQAETVAMANGDPSMIGYLAGCNFGRGFPQYVRDFNANFLALPALPGRRIDGASSDPEIVVRAIDAGAHGTYVSVAHVGLTRKSGVTITLPADGPVVALASGRALPSTGRNVKLDLEPCQLVALGVGVKWDAGEP